jgi:hypothetical protein
MSGATTPGAAPSIGALTLHYTQRTDEILHACRIYQRTTPKHRLFRLLGVGLVALGSWLMFVQQTPLAAAGFVGLGLLMFADLAPLLMTWLTFRAGVAYRQPYETTIDDEGVRFVIAGQRVTRRWSEYREVIESDLVFVLVVASWQYSVLPRRAIGDPQRVQQVREAIATRVAVRRLR